MIYPLTNFHQVNVVESMSNMLTNKMTKVFRNSPCKEINKFNHGPEMFAKNYSQITTILLVVFTVGEQELV